MYRAMWNHVECMHFCIPLDSYYLPIRGLKSYILLQYIRTFTSIV